MSRDVKPSAAKLATSVAALECDEGSRASASAADDTTPSFRPNSTIQSGPPCWKKKHETKPCEEDLLQKSP